MAENEGNCFFAKIFLLIAIDPA